MKALAVIAALAVLLIAAPARSQPFSPPRTPAPEEPPATPVVEPPPATVPAPIAPPAEPAPAEATAAPVEDKRPPIRWLTWDIAGTLLEAPDVVRETLAFTMASHPTVDDTFQAEVGVACEARGYRLIEVRFEDRSGGPHVILEIEPIPVVRDVDVKIGFWRSLALAQLDEAIKRRMRLRPGERMATDPAARPDECNTEAARLTEYLRDEGFFEARVRVSGEMVGRYAVNMTVDVDLGPTYHVGRVQVANPGSLSVPVGEIVEIFRHRKLCLPFMVKCFQVARFSRQTLNADVQRVAELFKKRDFPEVRVDTDYDPAVSFDRSKHEVSFIVTINERRKLDVVYEGNDPDVDSDDALDKLLTFNAAGNVDAVEIAASAEVLRRHFQERGRYDAVVTWAQEKFRNFDRVIFRIDQGSARRVRRVAFAGNQAISDADLRGAVATQAYESFSPFGGSSSATTQALADDVDRLRRLYLGRGYPDAKVEVQVGPDPAQLDSAATTAALLAAHRRPGDLWVRFVIVEGAQVTITRVTVAMKPGAHTDPTRVRERIVIADGEPLVATRVDEQATSLQSWFFDRGFPRAQITPVTKVAGNLAEVVYEVDEGPSLRIGKVMIRGNFKTSERIIREELGFREGRRLTRALAERGPQTLRATGLFNAVRVSFLDFETTNDEVVHVIVSVEERYLKRGLAQASIGYSKVRSGNITGSAELPNLWGIGIKAIAAVTIPIPVIGGKYTSFDGSLRVPHWLGRRIYFDFDTELAAFWRFEDTDRFGTLETIGASLAASRTWQRPRSERRDGRSISAQVRYDFRLRNRNESTVRVAGNNSDISSSPVATRTGAIGLVLSWDQRVDARRNLNPLLPERGFKLEAGASLAGPYLLGQDDFVKVEASGQVFRRLTRRLQLKADLRYDQGFLPIGNAVLLPEVERFFAGGDTTVRGFEEDRLATEIITEAVPPLGNISQIRILPAGGNIRAIGSLDAQMTVWQLGGFPVSSALFVDAGLITNSWEAVQANDVRPAFGIALLRILAPVGALSVEYAVPMLPREGDNPRGRFHLNLGLRFN